MNMIDEIIREEKNEKLNHKRRNRKWEEKQLELLEKLYKEGKNSKEISNILKKPYHIVRNRLYNMSYYVAPTMPQKKFWSKEEEYKLKELYKEGKSIKEIAVNLSRSITMIRQKLYAQSYYVKKWKRENNDKVGWTKEQDEKLKELYLKYKQEFTNSMIFKKIAKEFGRTLPAVRVRIYKSDYYVPEEVGWTEEEKEFLKNNQHLTIREIAKKLNKSFSSVAHYHESFQKKGKIKNKIQKWSKEEDEMVKDTSLSVREIHERIGRTMGSIYVRRSELGASQQKNRPLHKKELILKLILKHGKKSAYTIEEIESIFDKKGKKVKK